MATREVAELKNIDVRFYS